MTKRLVAFNKKDNWDGYYFYKVYLNPNDNNKKYIKYIFLNSREFINHSYMDWVCYDFSCKCEMSIEEFCEWDNFYARENLLGDGDIESVSEKIIYNSPQEAFECTNELLKLSKGKYWEHCNTADIDEHTAPGFYYGR